MQRLIYDVAIYALGSSYTAYLWIFLFIIICMRERTVNKFVESIAFIYLWSSIQLPYINKFLTFR